MLLDKEYFVLLTMILDSCGRVDKRDDEGGDDNNRKENSQIRSYYEDDKSLSDD